MVGPPLGSGARAWNLTPHTHRVAVPDPALELGVSLEPLRAEADAGQYIAVAKEAEALGFAGVFASDHVIQTQGRSFMEPITLLAHEGLRLCSLSLPAGAAAVRRSMHWIAEQVIPRTGATRMATRS